MRIMRTNIVLDDELVRRRRRTNLLDLAGQVRFADGFDHTS